MRKGRLIWYLRQLFPLRYESTYTANGVRMHTVWRMWFGRCFAIRHEDLGVRFS